MKVPSCLPDDLEMARLKRLILGRPDDASPLFRRFMQGAIYRWLVTRGAERRDALRASLAPEIRNARFVLEIV